jgi:hypothetical protein
LEVSVSNPLGRKYSCGDYVKDIYLGTTGTVFGYVWNHTLETWVYFMTSKNFDAIEDTLRPIGKSVTYTPAAAQLPTSPIIALFNNGDIVRVKKGAGTLADGDTGEVVRVNHPKYLVRFVNGSFGSWDMQFKYDELELVTHVASTSGATISNRTGSTFVTWDDEGGTEDEKTEWLAPATGSTLYDKWKSEGRCTICGELLPMSVHGLGSCAKGH